jgi:hypothetical protein
VEASLPQPGHTVAWMRWAAVFVPALVAAGLWFSTRTETEPSIAKQTIAPALQPVESVKPEVKAEDMPVATITSRKKTLTTAPIASTPIVEPEPAVVEETMAFEDITLEPVTLEEEVVVAVETPKPMVLVYTLDAVATPAPQEAERNTLNRVVDFARTVKHSDPIGDIRGLKDELFALDLRKKQPKKN